MYLINLITLISCVKCVTDGKLTYIKATEGLVHKCHRICVLNASQYEMNTKHFLTLLSTVLLKACSVCTLLSLSVIQCEPPALLCFCWLRFAEKCKLKKDLTKNWTTSYFIDCLIRTQSCFCYISFLKCLFIAYSIVNLPSYVAI